MSALNMLQSNYTLKAKCVSKKKVKIEKGKQF